MEIHEKDYIGLIESLRIKLGDFEEIKDLNVIYPKVVKYLSIFILEMSRTLALSSFPFFFFLQSVHSLPFSSSFSLKFQPSFIKLSNIFENQGHVDQPLREDLRIFIRGQEEHRMNGE